MIRNITHDMKKSKQGGMAIVECAVKMNTTAQKSSETTGKYFNIFEAQRDTVNTHDRRAEYHEGIFKKAMIKIMDENNKTKAKVDGDPVLKKDIKEEAMTASSEELLTCLFILLADNGRYKGLKIELANDFTIGQSNYPKTVVADKRLLMDCITTCKSNSNYVKEDPDDVDVAFSETDRNNDWKNNVSCHGCGFMGHQLKECNKTLP